jgi:hypothetical protein
MLVQSHAKVVPHKQAWVEGTITCNERKKNFNVKGDMNIADTAGSWEWHLKAEDSEGARFHDCVGGCDE